MNRAELAAIRDRVFAPPVEEDPDPVIRILNKHGVRAEAPLRQHYRAMQETAAQRDRCQAKLAEAEAVLRDLHDQHRALMDTKITLETPIPTIDAAAQYAAIQARATLVRRVLDAWQEQQRGYEQFAVEAERAWQDAWGAFKTILWYRYGDRQYQPAMIFAEQGRLWTPPDATARANLDAKIASFQ